MALLITGPPGVGKTTVIRAVASRLAGARRGGPRVGKYGVDAGVLEITARTSLLVNQGIDVYLVDEIGKMECLSLGFVAAMRELLDSGRPVVATIGERGGGFIAEVKRRPDVTLWRLTRDNRDAIPARILTWLQDRG